MIFPSLNEQMDLIRRGTVEIIPEEELVRKIEYSIKAYKPLIIKQGYDPTAPDIHLGHAVSLRKLRQFQDLGHTVVFLIGDFTGMVGDPSGQSKTRPRMSKEEILKNAETYREQIFKILDPQKTVIRFNSEWLGRLSSFQLMELASKYTVARLLERDDFSQRYRANQPISFLEFFYPLLQGYDSVALGADVELGGTDQKFNLLVGREIQREYGQSPQVIVTLPLLVGTNGTQKMSKSLNNYIGINEPPGEIYGKTMAIPDGLIYDYFELATPVSEEDLITIKAKLNDPGVNPRDLKWRLARELVTLYHGPEAARAAAEEFDRVFRLKEVPENVKEVRIKGDESIWIVDLLVKECRFARTNSEARRLIRQGAVTLDGRRITDEEFKITFKKPMVLKVGKRRFARLLIF